MPACSMLKSTAFSHPYNDLSGRGGGPQHDRLCNEAEASGVFGVPTFVFEGELFWGGDRIGLLRERLDEKVVKRRPA